MKSNREIFQEFLHGLPGIDFEGVFEKFSSYHELLLEANSRINLISRQTEPEEIWTRHFYDSMLPVAAGFDFRGKYVMDLGTGGGMPGIPLAILNPSGSFLLVDSKPKKIVELRNIIKKLDLKNCYPFYKRLEEFKWSELSGSDYSGKGFDIIVCRAVKMTPKLLKKMRSLLNNGGYILLYKGKEVEESWLSEDAVSEITLQHAWGTRRLLRIGKI